MQDINSLNRNSITTNQIRTNSLSNLAKQQSFKSNNQAQSLNQSIPKSQVEQEVNFVFFKEIMKMTKHLPSFCEEHSDPFVSYCMDCKKPMCVKCLLIHSRQHEMHSVKSLHELKNLLGKNIGSIMEGLKMNVERLEKYRMNLSSNAKLNEMRQQGIDQLEALKDKIFNRINMFFVRMHSQWVKLFDENTEMAKNKDLMVRELNQIIKMFLKAKQNQSQLGKQKTETIVDFQELKDLLMLSSLLDSKKKIDNKVTSFLQKLDSTIKSKQYPTLYLNKMVLNEIHDNFKYLFDFSFEDDHMRSTNSQNLTIKLSDFYKQSANKDNLFSSKKNKQLDSLLNPTNNFIPIIAKNRKLMVFDVMQSTFKELMLSDVHSIPHGNQLIISPQQSNRIFIIGGHFFKKPTKKMFELDTHTSEFSEHEELANGRWLHRVNAYKNLIFVSGGVENEKENPISSFEVFDTNKNIWKKVPDMLTPRHSHSMLIFEQSTSHLKTAKKIGTLYLFGGIGKNKEYNNSIEKYDIEKNTWSFFLIRNPIEFNIIGPFACQLNSEQIIVFGGYKYYLNSETVYSGNHKQDVR